MATRSKRYVLFDSKKGVIGPDAETMPTYTRLYTSTCDRFNKVFHNMRYAMVFQTKRVRAKYEARKIKKDSLDNRTTRPRTPKCAIPGTWPNFQISRNTDRGHWRFNQIPELKKCSHEGLNKDLHELISSF